MRASAAATGARGAPCGQVEAGVPVSASRRAASERVVAAGPGREAAAEQHRLRERAREVERLQRVDAGERAAGRGEPPRQLDGRGGGGGEEDEGAETHRSRRHASTALPLARRAIIRGVDPLVRLQSYLEWLIGHPVAELSRAQRFLRFAVDLVRHCSRELRENDAAQMAAALTYRTIFGLVPLLMVSMLAFRMFGNMEAAARHLQSAAYAFFNYQVDPPAPRPPPSSRLSTNGCSGSWRASAS